MPENYEEDILATILDAADYYDVLGISKHDNVDKSAMRRAYLKRSVKVHPDKNKDPRATEAFQRVAEAWNVLQDDETRAQYDARGNTTSNKDNYYNNDNQTTYTPPPPPSFQEALFAFAAATSAMGAGGSTGAMGNIAETLFWAQKLVDGRPESKTQQTANVAMALGSGLRAVAFGAKMMGFKNAAAAADKGAVIAKSVGAGAIVADFAKDNPAVQKALANNGERVKELGGSINQSIKTHLERPSVKKALEKGNQLKRNVAQKIEKNTENRRVQG
mmetsp:Transcript_8902/g.13661  ORF Transcript_8902/g.13661 Transcript_8902/m.13661 type:complete len:275 (-) Transcript_8902:305-1129(-)|eukprot:CAMPEP_0195289060 /NCGR_PEP_ID=MMETSP0707-20130614/5487_1 /TAXON_ID=33640 /ORGANISM="Asterionellopsis glacialis, Strain CCMP134" /LENGTH=274 /DNA_ID=CAMNT_0040349015 /DNA_START=1034 /DNA_END=1858 /DNA_ORIENTATION=-